MCEVLLHSSVSLITLCPTLVGEPHNLVPITCWCASQPYVHFLLVSLITLCPLLVGELLYLERSDDGPGEVDSHMQSCVDVEPRLPNHLCYFIFVY